jgi:hypothetical protein
LGRGQSQKSGKIAANFGLSGGRNKVKEEKQATLPAVKCV